MRPGFTILTDVSEMISPTKQIGNLHEKAQKCLVEAGLGKTAEIIPAENYILRMALEKWSSESGMKKRCFANKARAEEWLNQQ